MTANTSNLDNENQTTTVSSLQGNKLLRALDSLKTEGQQVPAHTAATLDAHEREHYAAMLVALLLQQANGLSETRSRLLAILLSGLQLADGLAALLPQAQQSDSAALRELKRLLEQRNLKHAFIVDALVLTRLDAPFDEAAIELFSELAFFLEIPQADLAVLADVASIILGIPCARDLPPSFDLSRIVFWEAYLYRTLSAEILAAGVVTGKWQVIDELILDKPWVLEKAQLKFSEQGKINTKGAGEVRIIDSTLTEPQLHFSGENIKVTIASSIISGIYPEYANITTICFKNTGHVQIKKSQFMTKNARSLYFYNAISRIDDCQFEQCGNKNLIGGAVGHEASNDFIKSREELDEYQDNASHNRLRSYISVTGTSFRDCLARAGGGIRATFLRAGAIHNCTFERCLSIDYQDSTNPEVSMFGGGAIWCEWIDGRLADRRYVPSHVVDSKFIESNVYIGDFKNRQYNDADSCVFNCSVFTRCGVGYKSSSNGLNDILYGCTGGNLTEISVDKRKWHDAF